MSSDSQLHIRGYQLGEQVATDGYSVTYRAYQAVVDREVALRVILPPLANQPEFVRRFEQEAQLIARLEHPHILPLYDYWREPGGAYLAMRWLPTTLKSAVRREAWSVSMTARLLEQAADALASAEREGILHQRLTLGAIRLDEDENAYLTDFGTAEEAQAGVCWSPEQALEQPITPRSQVYGLGLIAYELLTGEAPGPRDATSAAQAAWHLNQPLPGINGQRAGLTMALNEVLQTATAKDPLQRYASVLRFAAAFRAAVPNAQRVSNQPLADPLTERELDILARMVSGQTNAQIAQELFLTPGTVKWYVQQLYRKLDVHSRRQAIERARQLQLTAGRPAMAEERPARGTALLNPAAADTAADAPRGDRWANPYKGLRAFQEDDVEDFFGRASLTEKLLAHLADEGEAVRCLALVGPSGSGKSSVVRAGLIPALRRGALPNSQRWLVTVMTPGTRPLEELEVALARVAASPIHGLLGQLTTDRRGLVRAARRVLPSDQDVELLLLIDQFEELFVLTTDERARNHFIELILSAVSDPRGRVRVVLTLRADFYDRPLQYTRLAELMRGNTEVMVPMTPAELERVIVAPAERRGIAPEPGLVATILHDLDTQPGGLPLLEFALTELFESREGALLRQTTYQAGGGLVGALGRRAEGLYGELDAAGQVAARKLFLQLVRPGDGTEDTRRRVLLAEIVANGALPGALDEVLAAFERYRLLTFDRDPVTREPTVELAHEALLRGWPRLSDWITASRRDLQIQQALAAAAAEWAGSNREAGLLAAGTQLARFERLIADAQLAIGPTERAYVAVSAAEQARRTHDSRAQAQRMTLLRRGLVGVLVGSLVVVLGLLGIALHSRNSALHQAQVALARQLAVQAVLQLQNPVGNDEFAALLAVHSLNIEYSREADQALQQAAERLPLRQYSGHADEVYAAIFSPDGRTVLTASADDTARLWDAATGQALLALAGHRGEVVSAAFAPDGRFVVTGSTDRTARLWDAATGAELRTLAVGADEVHSVAFSPNGAYVLAGNYDGLASLWEAATGRRLQVYQGHADSIKSVAFSPDGTQVLTGSSDGTARLWETNTGRELRVLTEHGDAVYSVAFAPNGRLLATGSADNRARLWETATGRLLITLTGHTGSIQSVAFSADSRFIVTASGDNTAKLWQAATGRLLNTYRGHTGKLWTAVFSPSGQQVLTSSNDRTAKLWATQGNPVNPIFWGQGGAVYSVAISPDGRWLAAAGGDQAAWVWEAATGRLLNTLRGHQGQINNLAFSPDGRSLLTSSADHTARIWDAQTGRLTRTLTGHTEPVMAAAFSPDGRLALTTGWDQTARLWDTNTGELAHTLSGHTDMVWDAAFSPNGRYILTSSVDHTLRLWDAATYHELGTWRAGPHNQFTGLAFSPDSRYVLAASDTVQLWDVATGQPVQTFSGHTNSVHKVAYSPNGQYVLTGSDDATARLWDAATGREVRTLSGHVGAVWGVGFAPDGRFVVTGSDDGTARLWYADYHDLVTATCDRLLRDMTAVERGLAHLDNQQATCPPASGR